MSTYLHNLDPFALKITESFGIRWYGLSYLAGFLIEYLIIVWLSKRKLSPLHGQLISDFVFTAALGAVIGGRLGYCIFYSPELLTEFTATPPFWGVLALQRGGMASHGGIIGIIIACLYFAKKHKLPALHLLDLCTLGGTLGVFFGRIANFINGELVGRPCAADLAWAVKFPQDILGWGADQLRSLSDVVAALGVESQRWITTTQQSLYDRNSFSFVEAQLWNIINQVQAGNQQIATLLAPHLVARHPSQLYEALLEGGLLFIILMLIWRRPQKPGVVAACFFTIYSVVRIFGEQFRMPDPQIGFEIWGLTRGQILSFGLLLFGLVTLWMWSRRDAARLGGWGKNYIQS